MSNREKELLNALGRYPDASLKEIVSRTKYKRITSISRKVEQFKKEDILSGPAYYADWGKLCKNSFNRIFCILEIESDYKTVMSYLTLIEPLVWTFPVLSTHKKLLYIEFVSSNDKETESLLELLKSNNIITEYIAHITNHNKAMENPDFFGDFNPSLDNLLDPCDISCTFYGEHKMDWSEGDLTVFSYLMQGYKGTKLIEILKAEKKLNKHWTYDQIKYSFRKMVKNELIKKRYVIFPFSLYQCSVFNLLLKTDHIAVTQKILYNFARKERVYKECFFCKKWGVIHCVCYPPFLADLMYKLDKIDEIEKKELYQIRSISGDSAFDVPFRFDYFDVDEQTLKFPYKVYKEKIKEKLEND